MPATHRFENRTRSIWRFPRSTKSAKGRVSKQFGEGNTLVLGDVDDADIEDKSRTAHCPRNIFELTEAEIKNMGPRNLKVLRALVERGDVLDHSGILGRLEKTAA